tara:strand:- start:134 stop:340 length:207 start_codon:yes stop_codon:yes gene_type:complete
MWFFKKKKEEFITSNEFKEIEAKLREIDTRVDTLEKGVILALKKPTERPKKKEIAKDIYNGVLLPDTR